jgi:hypothetical protein
VVEAIVDVFPGAVADNAETQPIEILHMPPPEGPSFVMSSPELSSDVKRFAYQGCRRPKETKDNQNKDEEPETTETTEDKPLPTQEESVHTGKDAETDEFSDDEKAGSLPR